MENILITGVSGYLGRRLVRALAGSMEIGRIIGIDIAPMPAEEPGLMFHRMDIRSPEIGRLIAEQRIDTVFHLAFVVKPIHDLRRMHDIDYNGTRNVLEASLAGGVRHLIATSSTLAYGAHPDNPSELSEDAPLRGNPSYPYGYNKAVVDRMMQEFAAAHPEMTVTILRPCTVFGPAVDNYVSRMLFRPFTVGIMGSNPMVQFVHEDDFVEACLLTGKRKKGGAFNIVGQGSLTAREIVTMVGARLIPLPAFLLYPLLEICWRLRIPGVEVNQGYLDYARYAFIADGRKAREELGFVPRYSSSQALSASLGAVKRSGKLHRQGGG
ncbi:MAG: NAD-dependent epimerase/dehydratase family protein [Thermodesulfobacteriota bacterium]